MPRRPTMMPPVGKSGPGMRRTSSLSFCSGVSFGASGGASSVCSMSHTVPSMISPRLCGGMLVAMPTAMPVEPFTSRFG